LSNWITALKKKPIQVCKKPPRYFQNFTRFSNVFTSIKSQCFLITRNYIFCSMMASTILYPVTPDETGKLTHLQHFCNFYFKSLMVCSMGFSFKIQSAHCCSSSLIFATSVVNTLVISKAVQCTVHLVTNVAHGCLSRMGMNILNVAS